MPSQKSNTLPYLLASLGLIVVAIVFSAIVGRSRNTTSSVDIRTRASSPSLVTLTGVVSEMNEGEGTIIVDNLRFEDTTKSLGAWIVTPPPRFAFSSVFPGVRVAITVDPPTMDVESKTLTATEITILR